MLGYNGSIQKDLFHPLQNGKNTLFTVETVAERNGTIVTKQALSVVVVCLLCFNERNTFLISTFKSALPSFNISTTPPAPRPSSFLYPSHLCSVYSVTLRLYPSGASSPPLLLQPPIHLHRCVCEPFFPSLLFSSR